jgi:Tfp pilus assembly ATPase PilU
MQTMDMSLSALVKTGKISQQMAFERCHDAEELERLMGNGMGMGGGSDMNGAMMGGGSYA